MIGVRITVKYITIVTLGKLFISEPVSFLVESG